MQVLGHTIYDFHKEIYLPCEQMMLDNLWEQGILKDEINIRSHFLKKIFLNYTTKSLLNFLNSLNSINRYFLVVTPNYEYTEIHDYVTKNNWNDFYFRNIKQILDIYPVMAQLYDTYGDYVEFVSSPEFKNAISGDILDIKSKIFKKRFSKMLKVMEKYDLDFIKKSIFENHKNKILFR